jgi:hypothetical protein
MRYAILINSDAKCATVTKFRESGTRQERYFSLTGASFRRLQRVCAGLQPLPVRGYSGLTGDVMYAKLGRAE